MHAMFGPSSAGRRTHCVQNRTFQRSPVGPKSLLFHRMLIGDERANPSNESEERTMESFMNGVVTIEAGLLSLLLALWMTWLALHGLFRGCGWYLQPAGKDAGSIGRRSTGQPRSRALGNQSGNHSA